MVRHYDRSWLRRDLVAGIVLAAILVPQGMAYAELAGLPAVTGLYTTIACLVGYALFGPSRVLVLGPDSSVSPLIFAAIVPLLAGGDAATAVALAGMLAVLVGLVEIGLGLGKLGFVADLLSKEVQVGYMNGLAITIIVGQLPKLFGFSTDAQRVPGRDQEVRPGPRSDATPRPSIVGVAVLGVLLVLPRRHDPRTGDPRRRGGRDHRLGGARALRRRRRHRRRATPGRPHADDPVDAGERRRPAVHRGAGHHARLADRHDRNRDELRRAARRRGRARPGDGRHGRGERRRRALPGVRRLHQRLPYRGRRAVRRQEPGHRRRRRRARRPVAAVPQLAARGPPAVSAGRRRHRGGHVADGLRDPAQVLRGRRRSALAISLVATIGVILLGVLQGIIVAVALAIFLFFRRNWWPHGAVLGIIDDSATAGTASQTHPDARQVPGVVVYRWEAPLFFANAGIFRQQIRRLVRERHPAWVVLQCEAITDIDVTAAEMLEQLDNELNAAGIHIAFAELRGRLRDLTLRYGLFETLDRDHFYPTLEAAVTAIENERHPSVSQP